MNFSRSFVAKKAEEKNANFDTYVIKNGEHTGELLSVEYIPDRDRVLVRIKSDDEVRTFRTSIHPGDFQAEPYCNIIEPFYDDNGEVDLSSIKNYNVIFTTESNISKQGKEFSNITSFEYQYDESADM
ncbi:MAG: hypothetical protein ACI4JM_07340 [Oscillospiraceae bacterium]